MIVYYLFYWAVNLLRALVASENPNMYKTQKYAIPAVHSSIPVY